MDADSSNISADNSNRSSQIRLRHAISEYIRGPSDPGLTGYSRPTAGSVPLSESEVLVRLKRLTVVGLNTPGAMIGLAEKVLVGYACIGFCYDGPLARLLPVGYPFNSAGLAKQRNSL